MLIVSMFSWWYTAGWGWVVHSAGKRLDTVLRMFSVGTLLRTMFSPWKQIVGATGKDQPANMRFRAMIDSLISRFVGFGVRLITLFAAALSFIAVLVVDMFTIVLWPLIPVSIILAIIFAIGTF